jgi:hypothetical protein
MKYVFVRRNRFFGPPEIVYGNDFPPMTEQEQHAEEFAAKRRTTRRRPNEK